MGAEQKPGFNPEYPYTMADLRKAIGISNGKLRSLIDHDTRLTPETDEKGHVRFSTEDYQLLIQEKGKPNNLSSNNARKPEKTLTRASQNHITLPDGSTIKVKKDTATTTIIKGVLHAQQNNKPYTEQQMLNHGMGNKFVSDRRWIEGEVIYINDRLKPYRFELTLHEIEIEGKKIKALRITEIKEEKLTPSPVLRSQEA